MAGNMRFPSPRGKPNYVTQSSSKEAGLKSLCLDKLSEEQCDRLYVAIWEDVSKVHKEIAVHENAKYDKREKAKLSKSDIRDEVLDEANKKIYNMARPEIRAWYDHWEASRGSGPSFWYISWFLWHKFRYCDQRNVRPRHLDSANRFPLEIEGDADVGQGPATAYGGSTLVDSKDSTDYDPVRDLYRRVGDLSV